MENLAMNIALSAFLLVLSPFAPEHDVLVTRVGKFRLPLGLPEEETAKYVSYRNWVSIDRGTTWKLHSAINDPGKGFDFVAPKDGCYWFVLQTVSEDGIITPPKVENAKHADLKVYVNVANRIVIREVVDLPTLANQLQQRISAIRKFPRGE
jgi:hypothetical protein